MMLLMVIIDSHVVVMIIDRTHIFFFKGKGKERTENILDVTHFLYAFFRAIQCFD
jgi:hypothetical protein